MELESKPAAVINRLQFASWRDAGTGASTDRARKKVRRPAPSICIEIMPGRSCGGSLQASPLISYDASGEGDSRYQNRTGDGRLSAALVHPSRSKRLICPVSYRKPNA